MKSFASSVLTVHEVAAYLRVNQRTVYRLAINHKLPAFKVGTTWRFRRTDIDCWIALQSSMGNGANMTADRETGKHA